MNTIERELRCPAPRPTRLRAGRRARFAVCLSLFLLLSGLPLVHVARQILVFQMLQRDGRPVDASVVHRTDRVLFPGIHLYELDCVYSGPAGAQQRATVRVSPGWWVASPPGASATITVCDELPGFAALGGPSELRLGAAMGIAGYALLLFGLSALLLFGYRLRPYFRDMALVSLGTPVPGRVVGKTWKVVRRFGHKRVFPMIHFHLRDPIGVERVRTQIVDGHTWSNVSEGETMTVLFCPHRRGWFGAYSLLMAEAVPIPGPSPVTLGSERLT